MASHDLTDPNVQTALFEALATKSGCLVSSADCSEIEIADAQRRGDFYVFAGGLGLVHRHAEWLQRHSRFARNAVSSCETLGHG